MLSMEQASSGVHLPAARPLLPLQKGSYNTLTRRYSSATIPPSTSILNTPSALNDPDDMQQHIWIITGPAGCGKTTVAKGLANELHLPYIEGDDYHPESNKKKMESGTPLVDADRWDWLIQLREAAKEALTTPSPSAGSPKAYPSGVVATCSALKRKYRDVIRVAAYGPRSTVHVHFIYLRAPEEVLMQRVKQRKNHYMKSTMVHSQCQMMEEPSSEWDALSVDCAASPAEVQRRVNSVVRQKLEEYQ